MHEALLQAVFSVADDQDSCAVFATAYMPHRGIYLNRDASSFPSHDYSLNLPYFTGLDFPWGWGPSAEHEKRTLSDPDKNSF